MTFSFLTIPLDETQASLGVTDKPAAAAIREDDDLPKF